MKNHDPLRDLDPNQLIGIVPIARILGLNGTTIQRYLDNGTLQAAARTAAGRRRARLGDVLDWRDLRDATGLTPMTGLVAAADFSPHQD